MNRKEANKFSFGTADLNEIYSGAATPKFSSIKFQDGIMKWSDIQQSQLNCKQYQKQETKTANKEDRTDTKQQGKKQTLFEEQKINKLTPLNIFAQSSVRDIQSDSSIGNKSIKSIQSLITKLEKPKPNQTKKLGQSKKKIKISQKQFHSQSNLLDVYKPSFFMNHNHPNDHNLTRFKSLDKLILPYSRKNYFFPSKCIKRNEFGKTTNNFKNFPEAFRKNLEQNFQLMPSLQLSQNISHKKGTFFQIRENKNRQTVKFHSQARVLTNDKIQLISKHNEQLQKMQHF